MSALGQKRTLQRILLMSALPPIADIGTQPLNVRLVPTTDILPCTEIRLFDHFVGHGKEVGRKRNAENLRSG